MIYVLCMITALLYAIDILICLVAISNKITSIAGKSTWCLLLVVTALELSWLEKLAMFFLSTGKYAVIFSHICIIYGKSSHSLYKNELFTLILCIFHAFMHVFLYIPATPTPTPTDLPQVPRPRGGRGNLSEYPKL